MSCPQVAVENGLDGPEGKHVALRGRERSVLGPPRQTPAADRALLQILRPL